MAVSAQEVNNIQVPQYDILNQTVAQGYDKINQAIGNSNAAAIAAAEENRNWQERILQMNNEFNMQEAQKNRDWQEMMSNTAHQREVQDLIAAGLNPILSASGGNGASVTSGATASSGSAPSGSKADTNESAASAIVSLLSNFLSNATSLNNQMSSALVSMANTERMAENNEMVARLTGMNAKEVAGINAWSAGNVASTYVAGNLAQQELINQGTYNVAELNNTTAMAQTVYNGELEKYLKQHYPSNLYQAVGSGLVSLGDIFKGLWNNIVDYAGGDSSQALAILEYGLKSDKTDTVVYKMLQNMSNKYKSGQQKMHEKADKGDRI